MGSITSGRHHRERRLTTDEVTRIDIRDIVRLPIHLDTFHPLPRDQEYSLPLYVRVRGDEVIIGIRVYGDIQEIGHAAITWSPRNFGGSQPYLVCPNNNCGRRVAILYLTDDQIACRSCSSLDYQSQHDEVHIRMLQRSTRLRERLGGIPSILHPIPNKPRGMHRQTYQHLVYKIGVLEQNAIAIMQSTHMTKWVSKFDMLESMT